jgi:hypothetical protein
MDVIAGTGCTIGISNCVTVSAPENVIVTDCGSIDKNSKTTIEAARVAEDFRTDNTLGFAVMLHSWLHL